MKPPNVKHKNPGLAMALSLLMLPVTSMAQTTIYADDFNRTGDLHTSSPDTALGSYGGTAGATWTAAESIALTGTDAPFSGNALAYLPFIPESGHIYTLTMVANDFSWGAVGFTTTATPSTGANLNNVEGGGGAPAWILYQNDVANLRVGQGTENSSSAGGSGYNTVTLVLDTTGTNWTIQGSMNGTPYGSAYTFATNPVISTVALSAEYGGSGMTVDSFSLTTNIPEPTAALLGGLGMLALLRRRRA
jgi:hypothetical protein